MLTCDPNIKLKYLKCIKIYVFNFLKFKLYFFNCKISIFMFNKC